MINERETGEGMEGSSNDVIWSVISNEFALEAGGGVKEKNSG